MEVLSPSLLSVSCLWSINEKKKKKKQQARKKLKQTAVAIMAVRNQQQAKKWTILKAFNSEGNVSGMVRSPLDNFTILWEDDKRQYNVDVSMQWWLQLDDKASRQQRIHNVHCTSPEPPRTAHSSTTKQDKKKQKKKQHLPNHLYLSPRNQLTWLQGHTSRPWCLCAFKNQGMRSKHATFANHFLR